MSLNNATPATTSNAPVIQKSDLIWDGVGTIANRADDPGSFG